MPTSTQPISTTVQLPLRGHPVRYPFDQYELWLGVIPERELQDGQVVHQALADASGAWFVTVQE